MSDVAAVIADMVRAGVDPELIGRAAAAMAGAAQPQEPVRTARQERNRRYYEKTKASEKRLNASETSEQDACPPSPSLPPQTPPSRPHPPVGNSPARKGPVSELEAEFVETFWPAYPEKVSKPKALDAFRKARAIASLDEIMAGLGRYVEAKPIDRSWAHPTTWLNQQRWADEPAPAPAPGLRVITGHGPPRRDGDRARSLLDRMIAEEEGQPQKQPHDWNDDPGRTIDGYAHRSR